MRRLTVVLLLAVLLMFSVMPTATAIDADDFQHLSHHESDQMEFEDAGWYFRLAVSDFWDIRYSQSPRQGNQVSVSLGRNTVGLTSISCSEQMDVDEANAFVRNARGAYVNATFDVSCRHSTGYIEEFTITVIGWWRVPADTRERVEWTRFDHPKWDWQYIRRSWIDLTAADVGARIYGSPYPFPTTGLDTDWTYRYQSDQWQSELKVGWQGVLGG